MNGYTVYKHTAPNGKVYIGITCRNVKKRWDNGRGYMYSHNHHFESAIKKYGWDSFNHEILLEGLSKEAAEAKETELIAEYDATNPEKGYNIRSGGAAGSRLNESTRQKLSEMRKGENNPMFGRHDPKPWQLGNNRGIAGENHPMYGRRGADNPRTGTHHSANAIKKMRDHNAMNKAVRCVETGITYQSAEEASRAVGVSGNGIAGVCRHKPHYNTAGGYHWEYAE